MLGRQEPSRRGAATLIVGAVAQTYVNSSGAGTIVTVPAQGSASQAIASAVGMQQQVQAYGDGNNIKNQLNMVFQVQTPNAATAPMNNLLQTMRSQWQAGIR